MRGYHASLEQWTPSIGEVLSLKREPDNSHNSYSVAVVKGEPVVGHVPDQPTGYASTSWAEVGTGDSVKSLEAR